MLETYTRSWYQKLLVDQIANVLSPICSANFITLLALLSGILVPVWLYFSSPWLAVTCLLLSGYLDTLDGSIARIQDNSTSFGAALDIICDRIVEFAVILGLFLVDPARGLLCILMLGSMLICVTSFLIVGVFTENDTHKGFFYSIGLMERAEAFIFFIMMMLLPHWFNTLAILFTVLVTWTAVIHIYKFNA